jgi:predicted RNase H-like nuclease (RuvC/YqgF family)
MRQLFSGRNTKLKDMNRILTDTARKRAQRIEELEREIAKLRLELEAARKGIERVSELEVVAAQRAHSINEMVKEIATLRDALTKRSMRINELERALYGKAPKAPR